MYTFVFEESVALRIREASKKYGSIVNKLEILSTNPISRAIPTGIPIIGSYFVNCGRHALLFDIDEEGQRIILYKLVLKPYLHKILSGKIEP